MKYNKINMKYNKINMKYNKINMNETNKPETNQQE